MHGMPDIIKEKVLSWTHFNYVNTSFVCSLDITGTCRYILGKTITVHHYHPRIEWKLIDIWDVYTDIIRRHYYGGPGTKLANSRYFHGNSYRIALTEPPSRPSTRAVIIDAFVNKFSCSKHDVTMASGRQGTVRTCNDYISSKVRSFSSRCGRHDTLSLLTVITKVFVECIIEPAMSSALRSCQILMEQSKEMQK